MYKINRLEIVLTGVAGFLTLVLLLVMFADIHDFYQDKETYAMVYHLDINKNNWEWDYLRSWLYTGGLSIVGMAIFATRLINGNNDIVRKVNRVFLILFYVCLAVGIYNWMNSGFDH